MLIGYLEEGTQKKRKKKKIQPHVNYMVARMWEWKNEHWSIDKLQKLKNV